METCVSPGKIKKVRPGIPYLMMVFCGLLLCPVLSACGVVGGKPVRDKPFEDFGRFEPYDATAHTAAEVLSENDAFLEKITYGQGMGDFTLTPLKYGNEVRDFSLLVTNDNAFQAGAYITFVFKDEAGSPFYAVEDETRILAAGASDILEGCLGEDAPADYSELEITVWLMESAGKSVYRTLSPEGITEVGNVRTGRGRRIDLMYDEPHGAYVRDCAVFYDSEDHVVRVQGFITSEGEGKYACLYTEFDYARYEIFAWKSDGTAETLPDSVYSACKEAGCISVPGTEYESLDRKVVYDFEETGDGQLVIHCINTTEETVSVKKDCFLIYGDTELAEYPRDYMDLTLKPQEELTWLLPIRAGGSFWMYPVSARKAELQDPVPALTITEEGDRLHYAVTWGETSFNEELESELMILYRNGETIVSCELLPVENNYEHITEGDFSFDGSCDGYEVYMQYRYLEMPVEGV